MSTALKGYRFIVTDMPQADAQTTYAARGAHDDWRINAEARCFAARVRGMKVWAVQMLPQIKPTIYVTHDQAACLGLCVYRQCGKPADYVGFEGLRCSAHQKYGMSMLCSTEDCTNVSETGFSSHCKQHTTPKMRKAREAYQAELRARYHVVDI